MGLLYQKFRRFFCRLFRLQAKLAETSARQAPSVETRQSTETDTSVEPIDAGGLYPIIQSGNDPIIWPKAPPATGYPKWPPPSPRELMADPETYESAMVKRGLRKRPEGVDVDNSLFSLYRLYEHLILNHRYGIRNEIEYFWNRHQWAVSDIPDPEDSDPERYAVLSCIPSLLVEAFNENIGHGLPRDAPAIITDEMLVELNAREYKFEKVPAWTRNVPTLPSILNIVMPPRKAQSIANLAPGDDVNLEGLEGDERVSPVFKEKNIIICHPHIIFI